MSKFSEARRHLLRLREARRWRGGKLDLPRPLDLVVFTRDRADSFAQFFDILLTRTRWPLKIAICDGGSTKPEMLKLLELWKEAKAGQHEVRVLPSCEASHPQGFNAGLRETTGEMVAVSDADVIVPDLGASCWATELLKIMQAHPHVGWLGAGIAQEDIAREWLSQRFQSDERAPRVKAVWGTKGKVLDLPIRTELSILRRNAFTDFDGNAPQFDRLHTSRIRESYAVGKARDVTVEQIGWSNSSPAQLELSEPAQQIPFYIITRTHNRAEAFAKCRESIQRQTVFANVVHIVTCDDEQDRSYIPNECMVVKVTANPAVECWYETYMNPALEKCADGGLVMFLDDDDYLINRRVVEQCLRAYEQMDAAFFRVRMKPRSYRPRLMPFAAPHFGDVASCGIVLRTEIAKREKWNAGHGNDFSFINNIFRLHLSDRSRVLWSSNVIAGTQAGRSFGETQRTNAESLEYDDSEIEVFGA